MIYKNKQKKPLFYYVLDDVDISADDGPGVNEWDFVSFLLKNYPNNFVVFGPRPSNPEGEGRLHPKVCYVKSHRKMSLLHYSLFLLDLFRTLFIRTIRQKPDAIIVRPGSLPIVSVLISFLFRIPLFVKSLGLGSLLVLREKLFPLGKFILYPISYIVRWFLLRQALLIDVVSSSFIRWYCNKFRLNKKKFIIIPNGVNPYTFYPMSSKNEVRYSLGLTAFTKWVGFVGSITEDNCIYELINASKIVIDRYKDVGFIIIGDGPLRNSAEQMVRDLNISKHFVFTGKIPFEKIPQYINAFFVGIALFPTWWMRRNGSSSLKVRQYLACGIPIVGSKGEGHEFIEEHNLGWLVVPEKPIEVAEAICKALKLSPQEIEIISKRAREYAVKHFSIEYLVDLRFNIWLSILKK